MTSTLTPTTLDGLDAIRSASTLLDAIDLLEPLMDLVRADGASAVWDLQAAIDDDSDQLTAILAVHAASAGGEQLATSLLGPLLTSPVAHLREHAVWALRRCPPRLEVVDSLTLIRDEGGFIGMLAEATLETWGLAEEEPASRAAHAAPPATALQDETPGLAIAQLFLHADIDGSLRLAGKGDTGGIATLLVQLGDALVKDPRVARVVTLSRSSRAAGQATEAPGTHHRSSVGLRSPGHHYLGLALPGPTRSAADAWPLRRLVRREVRQALEAAGPVDVLHLRMADVGSWMAAEVAHELGIPTVLTLAPDPHALIAAREKAGELNRANFGAADHVEHLVFRVLLLRDLASTASGLVVFPRPHLDRDLRDLLHLDVHAGDGPSVVPEGIDLSPVDRAAREVRAAARGEDVSPGVRTALADFDSLLATLPVERRGLPLAVTVGRLHRVKGMATLVEAWASDPTLSARCNLLLVGGDLDDPSTDEAEQLARIEASVPREEAAARGLLLAGHRPNGVVSTWLAAVRAGRSGLNAPGGVYVSASLKEEFGIAILEALASGLVVVAPDGGGPATYIEDGVTGILVDTGSRTALSEAVGAALDRATDPDAEVRARRARQLVADRFGIGTMASTLADLYVDIANGGQP